MGEPARELDPAPRPVPDLLADVAQAYQRACEVVRPRQDDIAVLYLVSRMTELEGAVRDYASALREQASAQREHDKALIFGADRVPQADAAVTPLRRRRTGQPWPRAVQAGIPLAAVTAAKTGAAHGFRVKVLATGTVAAGFAGFITLGAGNSVNLPDVAHAATHASAAASPPRLAPADAAPYVPPSPYQARHSAGTESIAARHAPGRHTRPPVVTVTPPAAPAPAPPAPPPVAAAGTLVTSQVAVVLSSDGKGSLTFSAKGGAVTWSATSSSPAVSVATEDGSSSGTLTAEGAVILVITLQPGAVPGPVTITVSAADGNVITVPVMLRAGI